MCLLFRENEDFFFFLFLFLHVWRIHSLKWRSYRCLLSYCNSDSKSQQGMIPTCSGINCSRCLCVCVCVCVCTRMSDITDLRCTLNLFSSHNHTNERLPSHTHARINDFKSCKVKNNKSNTHTHTRTHTHTHTRTRTPIR